MRNGSTILGTFTARRGLIVVRLSEQAWLAAVRAAPPAAGPAPTAPAAPAEPAKEPTH